MQCLASLTTYIHRYISAMRAQQSLTRHYTSHIIQRTAYNANVFHAPSYSHSYFWPTPQLEYKMLSLCTLSFWPAFVGLWSTAQGVTNYIWSAYPSSSDRGPSSEASCSANLHRWNRITGKTQKLHYSLKRNIHNYSYCIKNLWGKVKKRYSCPCA
jgi:hypothetical protein